MAEGDGLNDPNDIRDPRVAERLGVTNPDSLMERREFLQRAAVAGGLAASLGTVLSPDVLLAEAAKVGHRRALPSPRNMPIDTFVVLMMENRSFDHYLGWMPKADGRQEGLVYTDAAGNQIPTQRLTNDFQGCAHPDPNHSWNGGRQQMNGGRMDGFLQSGDNDVFAVSYYAQEDVPFLPSAAKGFTAYDRFFCSLLASTYPNREYMHAAQSYGRMGNAFPAAPGFPDNTIFAALSGVGVSNRYFYSDLPVSALWGTAGVNRSSPVQDYYEQCASGTLPSLSFVDPVFAGEDQGTSGDEHPHGDIRYGQAFMSDVVHAFMESPQWKRGALFIVYDEWGGFFDHVRPPRVPDDRAASSVTDDFGQMGFRIPAVAVSPFVRRNHVDHGVYGFESILKMIRYRFGLPPLARRDAYARNIARSFDFDMKPKYDLPGLPDPATVVSAPCVAPASDMFGDADGAPERPKEHDLAQLYTSGYLDKLGFDYVPATAARTFRNPSSLGLKP